MPGQRNRFSEAQIRGFLREAAAGTTIVELCWNHCFSRSTFRTWKARYSATSRTATDRTRRFEAGPLPRNARNGARPRRAGEGEQVA
jgi:hypothetical protein